MELSIASVCLSGSLEEKIAAAAEAGFNGIEIFENDLTYCSLRPKEIRALIAERGLRTVALQPFRDFEGLPEPQRTRALERAERKFDLMGELGTELLLICSNVSPHAVDSLRRSAEDLAALGERAKTRGIRVGYEALAWGRHVRDVAQAWELVRTADHPNIGLVLDTFHLFARRNSLQALPEIPGEKVFLVQISDAPDLEMDVLQLSRHFRCFPGQGSYPITDFMRALEETGYDGPLSLEVFNDEFRAAPPRQIAVDGYRSFVWLEEQLTHRGGAKVGYKRRMAERLAEVTPVVPPPPSVEGIAFLEFAAHGDDAERLRAWLGRLGFAHTHQHRSKDVSLYSRGEVRFVVNEEPDSFAQSFYLLHGLGICALGLTVNSIGQALARAGALKCRTYQERVGPGELHIPGIAGVGGGILYFMEPSAGHEAFLSIDFTPTGAPGSTAGGAPGSNSAEQMAVDHLALATGSTELLSTLLYFRALLNLQQAPLVEMADPRGIVTSRALHNASGTLRVPINVSQSANTATQRFRERHQGSGIQHVAFRCDDLFQCVQSLDPELRLEIPGNYYDDLAARFDLDDALLTRLQQNQILYDRSDSGEFFHTYTRDIDGLFFEFLQRNGYGDYGQANASTRLAAQAREQLQSDLLRM